MLIWWSNVKYKDYNFCFIFIYKTTIQNLSTADVAALTHLVVQCTFQLSSVICLPRERTDTVAEISYSHMRSSSQKLVLSGAEKLSSCTFYLHQSTMLCTLSVCNCAGSCENTVLWWPAIGWSRTYVSSKFASWRHQGVPTSIQTKSS